MNLHKHPRLILLFAALVTVMCRCALPGGGLLHFDDGGPNAACKLYSVVGEQRPVGVVQDDPNVFECQVVCPDGQTVKVDVWDDVLTGSRDRSDYCPAGPTVTPTLTATATATFEPQAEAAYTSAPMLTQKVTACSRAEGFINFELNTARPELVGVNALVVINGEQVDCSVPSNNTRVLSCPLPAGLEFPAEISVALGDAVSDRFTYSGDDCFYSDPTNTPRPEQAPTQNSTVVPVPT